MTTTDEILAWAEEQGLPEAERRMNVNGSDPGKPPPQSVRLVEITEDSTLWHTPELEAFVTLDINGHKEHWPVRSSGFKNWLSRQFYEKYGTVANAQAKNDAFSVLEGKALFDGQEHPIAIRLADHDGAIYLDLANDKWEAVKITSDGWEIVTSSPVKFRRKKGVQPLPKPVKRGSVEQLRPFINIPSDSDWFLTVAWLIAAVRGTGPYPILVLHGEQGSAKSTAARVLKRLIDPNVADLRSEPKEPRDLMIAATNGWCIAVDNLSRIPTWFSNALCRLSTGGGFGTRTLYENDEETLFEAQRPIILNGIEEIATRGDLLDRTIVLYLPTIPKGRRKSEKNFWHDFEQVRPKILGAILDAVSMALRNLDQVSLPELPRMADFAVWSVAAMPALGQTPKAFLDAYNSNRNDANSLALEASPVVPPLQELTNITEGWEGTATELLERLNGMVKESTLKQKGWPKSPRALSNTLRRLAPNLREAEIDVIHEQTSGTGSAKRITIRKSREISDACDANDEPDENRHGSAEEFATQAPEFATHQGHISDAPQASASQSVDSVAKSRLLSGEEPLGCTCPKEGRQDAVSMLMQCDPNHGYGCPDCAGCRNAACLALVGTLE